MHFWGCEGSGATFHGLRMRSRSMQKCAHRNAGDLESSLAVCLCVYDPIHVTAQDKSLGSNCACVQPPRHYRGLPMNACVPYPMGSREFSWPYMGISTSFGSHDRYARFWLVEKFFAALWLVTDWSSPMYYLPFIQWYDDCILMLDGQLFHFPARKSQNAKEIVFRIDTPVCIITKTAITLAQKFTWWQGKRDDTWSMTAVRWKIFLFYALIPHKRQKKIPLCKKCFAIRILGEKNSSDVVQIRSFNG